MGAHSGLVPTRAAAATAAKTGWGFGVTVASSKRPAGVPRASLHAADDAHKKSGFETNRPIAAAVSRAGKKRFRKSSRRQTRQIKKPLNDPVATKQSPGRTGAQLQSLRRASRRPNHLQRQVGQQQQQVVDDAESCRPSVRRRYRRTTRRLA